MTPEEKVKELGLEIPEMQPPVASYVPGVKSKGMLYLSGQIPVVDGDIKLAGKVGDNVSAEEAYEGAKICCLNALGVMKAELGNLSRVKRIVKISGFVNSTPDFTDHSSVVNGASDLLLEIFGEKGRHARSAIGMSSLPLGVAVEVEMIVEFE